jgi:hypothetical protein
VFPDAARSSVGARKFVFLKQQEGDNLPRVFLLAMFILRRVPVVDAIDHPRQQLIRRLETHSETEA